MIPAYQNTTSSGANPGAVTTRRIALSEFVTAQVGINGGSVQTLVNARFIRLQNNSGHHMRAVIFDKFNQSFEFIVQAMTVKVLNFPDKLIVSVNVSDLTLELTTALDPFFIASAEDGILNSDASLFTQIVTGGTVAPGQWNAGFFHITASPYPIDIQETIIPTTSDDNTVQCGVLSSATAQNIGLWLTAGTLALQYPAQIAIGVSLFHTLIVVNNSSTALTGIQVYADYASQLAASDAITFSVPQGIYTFTLTYISVKCTSTAAGQQLLGTMRRSSGYSSGNNGVM